MAWLVLDESQVFITTGVQGKGSLDLSKALNVMESKGWDLRHVTAASKGAASAATTYARFFFHKDTPPDPQA